MEMPDNVRWKRIWYMLCFFALGIIAQRRGSLIGNGEITAANCTGIVLAAMLLPALKLECFRHKVYLVWSMIGLIGGSIACAWGGGNLIYKWHWVTGVLNVVVWGFLVIYLLRERRQLELLQRLRRPFFLCIMIMFLLMFFSAHEGVEPLWMMLIFGGFYLIGILPEDREDFFQGMLNGIILWFFVLQIMAYGFRPYDYVRYHGMYSSETWNGVFYMIVYCAFLCKWIWMKEQKKSRFIAKLCFFLSAGSISFLLFTGGRSQLMGTAMATLAVYTICDIGWKKNFYKWLHHMALLGICVTITFPLVYGTIRYLPTILHHPIWFDGEYDETHSVRSFDPWDSERYISPEEVVKTDLGRILGLMGIDIREWLNNQVSSRLVLHVQAAEEHTTEEAEPGSSPENPFQLPDTDRGNAISFRKTIFASYLVHLNWQGHSKAEYGFWVSQHYKTAHAHNMLIQMAYDYGIPVGILFLGLTVYSMVFFLLRALKGAADNRWICLTFFLATFFYGMTEMAILPGTMTWVLIYLLFYFVGEGNRPLQIK